MAKNKSEKCPHLSDYGGGYIRHDQWITEKLCANIAKTENIELPDKFGIFLSGPKYLDVR